MVIVDDNTLDQYYLLCVPVECLTAMLLAILVLSSDDDSIRSLPNHYICKLDCLG